MSKSIKKSNSKTRKSIKESIKPFSKMTYVAAIFITFVIVITGLMYFLHKEYTSFKRPNEDVVATIYHSEMQGIDAGSEYIYSIYKNKNKGDKSYFYIKSKASITMVGSSESKDVASGALNKSSDFDKITKDIEKDNETTSETIVVYSYVSNGKNVDCNTIEELANKLFSK